MKPLTILYFALASLLASASMPVVAKETVQKAARLDTLSLTTLSGTRWNAKSQRGKFVVVNFWATWCKPCVKEMPDFQLLSQRSDTAVLGLAYEDLSDAELIAFLAKLKVTYPVAKIDVYAPLPAPLVVLAQNNTVNAPGITINWTTTGGTLSAATSITGAGGLANIGLTLPAAPGVVTITGTRADDATVFATFTATATLVRTLTITSGNGQNATPGSPLPAPLVVNARNNGIAIAGVVINWTISPGSTLGAAANVTSGTGAASNTATLSTTPGAVTITATRQDDPTVFVTFIANGVKLANIPNLTPSQLSLATALDNICRSLNNLNSPTANQIDFRTHPQSGTRP